MKRLIECVPNISEGRDPALIEAVCDAVRAVEGVQLLDTDPGKATNRTVITFVGEPEPVCEAAFQLIKKCYELIDMSRHHGEHPRFGACDVCPLVPLANISLEETAHYAHRLGERVGKELGLSGYFYEAAATTAERRNLSTVRAGEYEGLSKKLTDPAWQPDFGPAVFNAKYGVTAIGARNFLIAYNVNLNTTSTRRANSVAFDVREAGRVLTDEKGKPLKDEKGETLRQAGKLKSVKAIGWYIEEYGICQISMNLTNIGITSIHEAFEAVCESAQNRGMRVTGSELVGLIPKQALLDAGKYFLRKQQRSVGVGEAELIKIAVKSLGLDDLAPFDPHKKVIEYVMEGDTGKRLVAMDLVRFADETASESPAPGGGSISAYMGALGAALGAMVANLSSHKRGWDTRWEEFSQWAERGQVHKEELLYLVDADTAAFKAIMAVFDMPKNTDAEKTARKAAMQAALRQAILVPYRTMEVAFDSLALMKAMAEQGNPNSVSDAGVGALCARSAVMGAYLNVCINAADLEDKDFVQDILQKGKNMQDKAQALETEILDIVRKVIAAQ